MRKFILPILFVAVVSSCSKDISSSDDVLSPTNLIDITLYGEVDSDSQISKGSYEPDSDSGLTYDFTWDAGDEVSVCVPDSEDNGNQCFEVAYRSKTAIFNGQVAAWSGEKVLYAVSPYKTDGYVIEDMSDGGYSLDYSVIGQSITPSTESKSFEEGLLVAMASGATAESESSYSIPSLAFKQALAAYQLQLIDIPDDEVVTEIGFMSEEDLFVTSAKIALASGEIVAESAVMGDTISATVSESSEGSLSFNFLMLPVDLSQESITLYVVTGEGDDAKQYTLIFETGVNFARNSFVANSKGALSLTSDFTPPPAVLSLSDISYDSYPDEDYWIITDSSIDTYNDWGGLEAALGAIAASREITLEFSNLASFGDYGSFYGCTALKAILLPELTSVTASLFYGCTNLASIYIPKVTIIKDQAFSGCTALTEVSLPAVKEISNGAFSSCINLKDLYTPEVETIGLSAFQQCSSLVSVSFPKVTTIFNSVFNSCNALESVELSTSDGVYLNMLGTYVFYNGELSISNSVNIDLTIGVYNLAMIDGKTLSCSDSDGGVSSYTFKSITYSSGSSSIVTGSVESGLSVVW